MPFKFSDINGQAECCWENLYRKEEYPDFSRLLIGCKSGEIPLILDFCKNMEGPFGVLHVLVVSRLGQEPGRYQTPDPLSYEQLEAFLYEYQDYFEQDGRANLWVASISGEGQFIYDRHNYIYAYGDVNGYIEALKPKGFQAGDIVVPVPHGHAYHAEFDPQEEAVGKAFEWIHYPLQDEDEE